MRSSSMHVIFPEPLDIIFLCSGNGGNLKFIHHCKERNLMRGINSIVVFSDQECPALKWAKAKGLKSIINKAPFNENTSDFIQHYCKNKSLIVSNYDKILSSDFLESIERPIINLHYSLLPSFAKTTAIKTLKNALDYGCKIIGSTVHRLTEDVDMGAPVAQTSFAVAHNGSFELTMRQMFTSGCISLGNAIISYGATSKSFNANQNSREFNTSVIENVNYLASPHYNITSACVKSFLR